MPEDTIAPENPPEEPDEIAFLDTGNVRIRWQGSTWLLRCPGLGAIEEFHLRMLDLQAENGMADQRRASILLTETRRVQAEGVDIDPEVLKQSRALVVAQYDRQTKFWAWAFPKVARKLPTSKDEWPPCLANAGFAQQVLDHWRSVPLGRGSQ